MLEKIVGYKSENGKLVVDENEAKVVQMVYEKYTQYSEHPPKELVDEVIEQHENTGKKLSYEEAEKMVSVDAIIRYITKEVNQKFAPIIIKENMFAMLSSGEPLEEVMKYSKQELEPIVTEELYEKVQEAMRMKM